MYKSANLVMEHGKRALVALSGRGVGPDTAARILSGFYDNEDEFLRDILSAEMNYARTKKFWD
jgi:ATP-dependent Lhr-like helicase